MIHPLLFSFLLAGAPDSAAALAAPSPPSSNLIFQLDKQNRGRPWLRVTTASARLDLTAERIDDRGLRDLEGRGGAQVPANLSWREIGRIDEVVTRRGRGRLVGTLALGLAGAGLGNAIGAPDHQGGKLALLGFASFGSVGRWLGGRYGERFRHERNWYVASAPAVAIETPIESDPAPVTAPPEPGVSRREIDMARRISPHRALRVEGEFGRFQGYADIAGPGGLERLRPDRRASGRWAGALPKEPVTWDTIDEIRMRGGSGMYGAVIGALPFGALGALFGAGLASLGGGDTGPAIAAGFAIGAGAGATIGAAMGSGVRRWVVVYRRP